MSDVSDIPSDEGGEGPCLAHLFEDAEPGVVVKGWQTHDQPPSLGADEVGGGAVGDPLHGQRPERCGEHDRERSDSREQT